MNDELRYDKLERKRDGATPRCVRVRRSARPASCLAPTSATARKTQKNIARRLVDQQRREQQRGRAHQAIAAEDSRRPSTAATAKHRSAAARIAAYGAKKSTAHEP